MNQKGFSALIPILIFALFFGGLGYAFYKGYLTLNTSNQTQQTTPATTPQPSPVGDETANWKTYINTRYGYRIQYPMEFVSKTLSGDAGNKEVSSEDRAWYISKSNTNEPYIDRYLSFEFFDGEIPIPSGWQAEKMKMANIDATKLANADLNSKFDIYHIQFPQGGKLEIYVANTSDKKNQANQILSTFNLTDVLPSPTMIKSQYPANPDLENLVKIAAGKYFDKYKTSTKNDERLLDYSIEEINQAHLKNSELRFFINYSVKIPTNLSYSIWQAGNGSSVDKDGWIKNNKGYASAEKLNDEYQVQGIATGAGPDF